MREDNMWSSSKPVLLIITAIVTWVISFVLFIVGLKFGTPVILFARDISAFIAMGISFVITMVELSLNDAIVDREKDFILIGIGIAAYALGISVGYVALRDILSLSNDKMEIIACASLSMIFEIAPERLMIWGLRNMGLRWSDVSRNISGLFQRNSRSQQSIRRTQPRAASTRYVAPTSPISTRTPRVQRPGHVVGQQNPSGYIDEMEQLLRKDLENEQ